MALLKLSREDLVEVDKLYKGGALDKPEPIQRPQSKGTVRVRNSTNALFSVGAPIAISGFASSMTFAQARKRMIAGTLVLNGQAPSSGAVVGACVSPIAGGKIGDVEIDLRFGIVTFSDSSHQYATETFASAESGSFRIVARSGYSNGLAVCALVPVIGTASEMQVSAAASSSSTTASVKTVNPLEFATGQFYWGTNDVLTKKTKTILYFTGITISGSVLTFNFTETTV